MTKYCMTLPVLLACAWMAFFQSTGNGAAAPTFGSPALIANTPKVDTMIMGDFDGDGIPDVATLDKNSGSVEVHFGDGQGGFRSTVADFTITGSDSSISSLAEGDLDGCTGGAGRARGEGVSI
jgi:hypothetical protein